jgi:hypothetical protein
MAIRRPSIYRQNLFVFHDFLYYEDGPEQGRYIVGKYDGEPYGLLGETFDFPSPSIKGGAVVSRIDYTLVGNLITVEHWEINWRDEWPLRLAAQTLANCIYPESKGFHIRVNKEAYPFWVSENFFPVSNVSDDYLIQRQSWQYQN